MANLIITMPAFTITSSWRSTYMPSGSIYYTDPTTGLVTKKYQINAIPAGSIINSATLSVVYAAGNSGGTLRVNGSTIMEQDITAMITPNSVGNFTEISVPFSYTAYGKTGQPAPSVSTAIHYSTCSITKAEISIDYVPGSGAVVDEAAYRAASLAPARDLMPRAVITYPSGAQQPIPADQIIRFTINEGVKSGILLGAVSSAVLELRLANDAGQWNPGGAMRGTRTPLGAKVAMEIGIKMDGEWAYQPAGVYNIDAFIGKATEPAVTLKGYDDMAYGFEKKFSDGLTYPATLVAILTHISEQAGIPYVGGLAANGSISIPSKPDWGDDCTLRQALAWVCQAGASYGSVDRKGVLSIQPTWNMNSRLSLTPEHYMESTHDERKLIFNTIRVETADGETLQSSVDTAIGPNASNTVEIRGNPLFVSKQTIAQTMADNIASSLANGEWQAADFRWRGDPTVLLGCFCDITERSGGKIWTSICNQSLKWDQGFSMTGKCDIDIGRDFADLGYDETTIGGLPAGTKIRIEEADGNAWYTIVSTDYSGAVLIWRDEIYGSIKYFNSTPSSESANRYLGSALFSGMNAFAHYLPENTAGILTQASVPMRLSAADSDEILYSVSCFALSAAELGLSTVSSEGTTLSYLGTIKASDIYWTREVIGGMSNAAYSVGTDGLRRNDTVTINRGYRPALAVYKNTPVVAVSGGFAPAT